MTRAHIADPHIVEKIKAGIEERIRPCVGMGYCIDSIYAGEASCVHNASQFSGTIFPWTRPISFWNMVVMQSSLSMGFDRCGRKNRPTKYTPTSMSV